MYLAGLSSGRACPLCDFFRAICVGCGDQIPPILLESPLSGNIGPPNVDGPYVVEESASQVLGVVVGQLPIVPVFHLSFGKWSVQKHYFLDDTCRSPGLYFMDLNQPAGCVAPRKIGPRADFELVRTWIDFCDRNHACRVAMVDVAGLRLLNCWTLKVEEWVLGSRRPPFVAASYVWGSATEPVSLEDELSSDGMPALVKDLVRVVTNLGYEHLWIDRYCIPQGNAARGQQIRQMNAIFHMATLTIISAAGTSPRDGLHGVSQPRLVAQQAAAKVGTRTFIQLPTTAVSREVECSLWNSRAWTYQEGLLSRRRLVFTESQCYFQCCVMSCVEWLSMPLQKLPRPADRKFFPAAKIPSLFPLGKLGPKDRKELGRMVEEYSARSLSYNDDRLDAFRGVLSCFESCCAGLNHICGVPVWETDPRWGGKARFADSVVAGLSWLCEFQDAPPARVHSFPTWSWAGWDFSCTAGISFSYPFINGRPPGCSGRGVAKLCWVSKWPDAGQATSISVEPGNKIVERYAVSTGRMRHRPQALSVSGWWCYLELAPSFDVDGALCVVSASKDSRLYTSKRSLKDLARAQRWKPAHGRYRIRCWIMGLGYCCSKTGRTSSEHCSHRELLAMALVEAGEWSTFERQDVFTAVVVDEVAGSGLDDVAKAIGCKSGEFRLV
jgi:hypothetical protein